MAKVDAKGRVVLPQEVRERLGVTPGTEVDIREEDGKVVVEPEDDPDHIIERMESIIEGISERAPAPYDELDPQARDHVETIRRRAAQATAEDDSG